jgi:hypothetical protein
VGRKDTRRRVNRQGTIHLGGGKMSCRILDSSAGGAMLELSYSMWLPPRFELEDSGVRRQVALVWQGAERAGVRFVDEPQRRRRQPAFGRRGPSREGSA